MIRRLFSLIVCAVPLLAGGCKPSNEAIAPPQVRYGQIDCAECGMGVSDERYVAALIVRTADGEQTAKVFEDIGCMIGYEREHADVTILARYVKDFENHNWLTAEKASFVRDDQIHSPMGFGVLAADSSERASKLAPKGTGDVLDLATLREALRKNAAPVAKAH